MSRRVFWAAHGYEVIPCHLIAPKDRDSRGPYAANSKRDKRRFTEAYSLREEAEAKVIEYIRKRLDMD